MIGKVFNIQRFSLHDGPGIRTTVFLMGCNLHCRWCHNPEGMSCHIRLQYDKKKCIGCGACTAACPNGVHEMTAQGHVVHFDKCTGCGKCMQVCPAGALSFSGKEYTAEELAEVICRDRLFYKDNGGVTFSGGEPLLQADFIAETAKLCKDRGVPTVTVDTAGLLPRQAFEKVLPYVDNFLFDVKAGTEETHIKGTGVSNVQILENLQWLDEQGKNIYIRIPVIPSVNDAPEEHEKIRDILKDLKSVKEVRLIPYHTFGREKYATMGYPEPEGFPHPEDEMIEKLRLITGAK